MQVFKMASNSKSHSAEELISPLDGEHQEASDRCDMPRYYLPSHVYFCKVYDGVIFLDLRTCKYHGLEDAHFDLVSNILAGPRHQQKDQFDCSRAIEVAEELTRNGLLTRTSNNGKVAVPVSIETRGHIDCEDDLKSRSSLLRYLPWVVSACVWTRLGLHQKRLERVVSQIAHRNESATPDPSLDRSDRAKALALIYRRLRPLVFNAKGACLFDSLALVRFLSYFDVPATFVIGVGLKPFSAHSWVQHGGVVLNDSTESLQRYVPILAV
jgi:hypothetical protein